MRATLNQNSKMKAIKIVLVAVTILVSLGVVIAYLPTAPRQQGFMDGRFEQVEANIENKNVIVEEVSSASVGWHLHHILQVSNAFSNGLKSSEPSEYEGFSPSFSRSVIFLYGDFPRGTAQAPESVQPPSIFSAQDLRDLVKEARLLLDEVYQLPESAYMDHPVFGQLNKNQTLRFLEIHTDHHFLIIDDILKASN